MSFLRLPLKTASRACHQRLRLAYLSDLWSSYGGPSNEVLWLSGAVILAEGFYTRAQLPETAKGRPNVLVLISGTAGIVAVCK